MKYSIATCLLALSVPTLSWADTLTDSESSSTTTDFAKQYNPIHTEAISLGVTPDARGGSMGDVGAATDPDENSQYWNPAKYAFAYSRGGIAVNYTPWLRKIVSDINLAYICGYWKFGYYDNQAVSASLRYFSLGEVDVIDYKTQSKLQVINPMEMMLDLGYSRQLSENFSMGVVMRYIHSKMTYNDSDNEPANTWAADLAAYYTAYPQVGYSECQWSWGANLSNVGGKISYDGGATSSFLPCNLRIGTSFTFPMDDYNLMSLNFDANKLLVPTYPQSYQFTDENGLDNEAFEDAKKEYYDMSGIKGLFKSFNDAPGGGKEEFHEINWGFGMEYTYDRRFFLRAGYHHENEYKGNRKYFTFGAGIVLNVFHIDAGYVLSTAQQSALDQTLRFSLGFDLEGLRDLMGTGRRR
ncbi:MAG: type IX secretion system outer membrane channel protein PorV [Bacteroidales bacterium]|nr:type IX secretion system outer membrane channel protein PorV [Bacteroidales bacterium]